MVEQVTKSLKKYIFLYKKVRKEKSFSKSHNEVMHKDEFRSRFRHDVDGFKTLLPFNLFTLQIMGDFGDASALFITMESRDKINREQEDYMTTFKTVCDTSVA